MNSKNSPLLLAIFFLIALIVAIYGQVQNFEFINLDDNYYVTLNRHIQNGLNREDIKWAFTNIDVGQWIPLVWLSYMVDNQLCGLNPGWFHIVNVFFHIANSILLFLLMIKLTGGFWKSVCVSAIFAVHPIHVESVAWVTERKDVLSMFFFLLCLRFYASYAETRAVQYFLLSISLFALGLMAKPMLVTLPFILLLLDFWPLRRIDKYESSLNGKSYLQQKSAVLIEKIPFVVLSIAISGLTLFANKKIGGLISIHEIDPSARFLNSLISYAAYLKKMVWPAPLAVPYPYPTAFPWWEILASAAILGAITIFTIHSAPKKPYLIVGWLWFIASLFPVIGIAQAGTQAMADRFLYLPAIGIYIIVVWSANDLIRKSAFLKTTAAPLVLLLICILALVSFRQIGHWKNSITLFTHVSQVTTNNFTPYFNLGDALQNRGELSEAIAYYEKALQIMPKDVRAHRNLGSALLKAGEPQKAILHLKKAASLKPDQIDVLNNLAIAYYWKGDFQNAAFCFRGALKIDPDNEIAQSNLQKLLNSGPR